MNNSNCERLSELVSNLRDLKNSCRLGVRDEYGDTVPYNGWKLAEYSEHNMCLKYNKEFWRHQLIYLNKCSNRKENE